MSRRRICVVTGTRAEYGLLRGLIAGIVASPTLELQLIVTGMHLSPAFGMTVHEIEQDGFHIDRRVDLQLTGDTPADIARSTGLGLAGFGEALPALRPDVMVVLGDRFEIFAAAAAALLSRVPVAHIHGGEATEGAIDEAFRHAVTKMSHLHFVAAPEYRRRVIQLGENPERVFLVGGLGVDAIRRVPILDRPALEAALGFDLGPKSLLVTFHPATLEENTSRSQIDELLAALDRLDDTTLIITMPNADTDGRVIADAIAAFVDAHPNAHAFASLGQQRYFSCLRYVDGVVGNSSSGLAEAPSFGKGAINIGDRQRGRLKAESVIDCEPTRNAIAAALTRLYSRTFQATAAQAVNPYGDGGASERILRVLELHPLESIVKKRFFDAVPAE